MKNTISILCSSILIASICTMDAINVTVTSNQDPTEIGKITLRDAITLINNSEDATNTISFNLNGADTVIFLDANEGQLPTIVNQVTLNGIDQASQKMVFIDGTNIPIEGSEAIHLNGLHFSNNGITSAANSEIRNIGIQNLFINSTNSESELRGIFINGTATNCIVTGCTIQNLIDKTTFDYFYTIYGIYSAIPTKSITNNTIENLTSNGPSSLYGLNCIEVSGNCNNNRINNLQATTVLIGITINNTKGDLHGNIVTNLQGYSCLGLVSGSTFEGDCSHNFINNLDANTVSLGILISKLNGNCSNNTISNISSKNQEATGIYILQMTTEKSIHCNTITNLKGVISSSSIGTPAGIDIRLADGIVISHNLIEDITFSEEPAQGIFAASLTNSLIAHNTITNINTPDNTGYGITLTDQSTGNDILSNSISSINGKAINIINNQLQTDALIHLNSVSCNKNCKLTIKGSLLPDTRLTTNQFLIQFFVSCDNKPSETKTLIGEYIYNSSPGNSFNIELIPLIPTHFGQYLTATATALVKEPNQNLNTSEVSNALPVCAVQNNPLCTECPLPNKPPVICPVNCSNSIL